MTFLISVESTQLTKNNSYDMTLNLDDLILIFHAEFLLLSTLLDSFNSLLKLKSTIIHYSLPLPGIIRLYQALIP